MVTQSQPTDTAQAEKAEEAGWGVSPHAKKSPVQEGVEIVTQLVQLGTDRYPELVRRLHQLMQRFALDAIHEQYEPTWRREAQERQSFAEFVLDEANEDEPFALAYWAATSAFFRKVYQAAAASA